MQLIAQNPLGKGRVASYIYILAWSQLRPAECEHRYTKMESGNKRPTLRSHTYKRVDNKDTLRHPDTHTVWLWLARISSSCTESGSRGNVANLQPNNKNSSLEPRKSKGGLRKPRAAGAYMYASAKRKWCYATIHVTVLIFKSLRVWNLFWHMTHAPWTVPPPMSSDVRKCCGALQGGSGR